ncbi:MAG: hypothetical protein C0622_08615 [Desulfuromonas sp.]|nr:MAG: hypothetical protein C0622_08615 [Desulfuromonas sp.]
MNRMKSRVALLLALILLVPLAAWAAPNIKLTLAVEKEVTVEENGQQVVKRIEATEVTPGETLIYTIKFDNQGDEKATNVAIVDPIPTGAGYVAGSATAAGELTFSIDNGQSYKRPSLLTYEVTNTIGVKEQKIATPEEYTHIRWLIPEIAAGEKGAVSFRVLMK